MTLPILLPIPLWRQALRFVRDRFWGGQGETLARDRYTSSSVYNFWGLLTGIVLYYRRRTGIVRHPAWKNDDEGWNNYSEGEIIRTAP